MGTDAPKPLRCPALRNCSPSAVFFSLPPTPHQCRVVCLGLLPSVSRFHVSLLGQGLALLFPVPAGSLLWGRV